MPDCSYMTAPPFLSSTPKGLYLDSDIKRPSIYISPKKAEIAKQNLYPFNSSQNKSKDVSADYIA